MKTSSSDSLTPSTAKEKPNSIENNYLYHSLSNSAVATSDMISLRQNDSRTISLTTPFLVAEYHAAASGTVLNVFAICLPLPSPHWAL